MLIRGIEQKKILTKLRPYLINNSNAQEAIQIFIDEPNNLSSKVLLRNQLEKILEDNKQLAREIAPLIKRSSNTIETITIESSGSYNTIQKGDKNISIGRGRDITIH